MDQKFSEVSNNQLIKNLKTLKAREDQVLVSILEHIYEFERRNLYLVQGKSSLYDYLTQEMGYTESEAFRRMESARFLATNPELKTFVHDGHLTMTSITEIRAAVRSRDKTKEQKVSRHEQVELAKAVLNCSKKEAQKVLAQRLPDFKPVEYERKQELVDGGLQITLRFTKPQRLNIQKVKDIMVRSGPIANTAKLIDNLSVFFLRKKDLTADPSTHGLNSRKETVRNPAQPSRPKLAVSVRRAVFQRDGGRCQFKNGEGKICGTTYDIAIDHILPVSAGGGNELGNLRCLCRAHNQWKGDRILDN